MLSHRVKSLVFFGQQGQLSVSACDWDAVRRSVASAKMDMARLALDYNRIVRRAFLSAANGRHRLAGSYADTGATVLEAEDVVHVIAARRRPLGLDEGDAEIRRSPVVACTALERLRSLDDYYDLIENVHIFICVVIVIVILH